MDKADFFTSLRQELIKTQEIRFKLSFQKLIFIISLLGIGSFSIGDGETKNLKYLVYFVPFVAYMFDLYVIGENFGIRRIGNYIKFARNSSQDEKYWEFLLNMPQNINRDRFAIHGNIYSTFISIALAAFLVFFLHDSTKEGLTIKIIWSSLVIMFAIIVWVIYPKMQKSRLTLFKKSMSIFDENWEGIIKNELKVLGTESDPEKLDKLILALYKSKEKKVQEPEKQE